MFWHIMMHLFSTFMDWIRIGRINEHEKDLEILILRQQLGIAERKLQKPVCASRVERLTLAVLTMKLRTSANYTVEQLRQSIRIFQPKTVLGWHRQLVKRKWTYNQTGRGGRPRTDRELENLVVRMARENDDFGYDRIQGELEKLGYIISDEGVANILRRHGIPPAPDRGGSPSWRHLRTHYKDQILACDFFTVETLFLKTVNVLFFIEIGSRRVHFAGCTTNPTGGWVTQQARQITWELDDANLSFRFLIRDRDGKFTEAFDTVFRSEGMKIIRTPRRAPDANSHAERYVRTVRSECLDKIIIVNQAHLRSVLTEYIQFYNERRPHQGISQQSPIIRLPEERKGSVQKRPILGGIINDYYRMAA